MKILKHFLPPKLCLNKKIISVLVLLLASVSIQAADKPNVLIFLIDDLRTELNSYGSSHIKSPNIDNLAKQGVQFNQAYSQQALCGPSRVSIMTGLRPETTGIYSIDKNGRLRKNHPDVVSMPQLFKENGYETVSIGKVYHSTVDDQESWTMHIHKEGNTYVNPDNKAIRASHENEWAADAAYKDGRVANHAVDKLRELQQSKFMMVVGFSRPHLPFNAPRKYWNMYDRNNIAVPSRKKPNNMYNQALTNWGELRGYGDIPATGDLNDNLTKTLIHGYYASVSYIDAQIGKVMAEVERLNLRDNTMIVFMSDHGYKIGEYGTWNKHSNMQMDVKVPLIISRETSHKGRKTNVTSEALVENIDIFPTIVEAAGLTVPKIDGQSLIKLIDNPTMSWDKAAYGVYAHGKVRMGVTVTDGVWRYTEWRNSETQKILSKELYWHKKSPVVGSNVAGSAKYKKIQDKMKKLLDAKFPTDAPSFNAVPFIGNNAGTPVSKETFIHLKKSNNTGFALDGGTGASAGQNVKLWTAGLGRVNQQWQEISVRANYYRYKKRNSNFCLDAGKGGKNKQNIRLMRCNASDQNQHFKKVSFGGDKYQLIKRNSAGFAIDGGTGGAKNQNIKLWQKKTSATSNQIWTFTKVK